MILAISLFNSNFGVTAKT